MSIREREENRRDFSIAFLNDAIENGTLFGYNPLNHIGSRCGVSWTAVYQTWDNIWFHSEEDHKRFQAILRGEKK